MNLKGRSFRRGSPRRSSGVVKSPLLNGHLSVDFVYNTGITVEKLLSRSETTRLLITLVGSGLFLLVMVVMFSVMLLGVIPSPSSRSSRIQQSDEQLSRAQFITISLVEPLTLIIAGTIGDKVLETTLLLFDFMEYVFCI